MFQVTLISFYENVTNDKLTTLSSSLRTYLFAIGKYKILRDKKKGVMYANLDDIPDIKLLGNEEDGYALELEQQTKVHAALAKLGGDCQKLLEMFYFQELSKIGRASCRERV